MLAKDASGKPLSASQIAFRKQHLGRYLQEVTGRPYESFVLELERRTR